MLIYTWRATSARARRSTVAPRAIPGLLREPAHTKTDRGGVRLDQDGRGMRRTRGGHRQSVGRDLTFAAAAYTLLARIPKLIGAGAWSGPNHMRDRRTVGRRSSRPTPGIAPISTLSGPAHLDHRRRWPRAEFHAFGALQASGEIGIRPHHGVLPLGRL